MGSISLPTILAYGISIILMIFIITAFKRPARLIAKLVLNTGLGLLVLVFANSMGSIFNFHVPINLYTVLTTGILGLPGFILTIILTKLF